MLGAADPRAVSKNAAALAFVALICLPLIFLGHPTLLESSLSENRTPNPFPTTWSIKYLERLSDFFNDNQGFRNALVNLGSRVTLALGVKSTHPSVVVGEDGWLFFTDSSSDRGRAIMADFRGRDAFTREQLAMIRANLETLGRGFERCRIPFVLWLIPDKQSIYGEHLTGFTEAKGHKRIDQLVATLAGVKGAEVVDSRPLLLAAKTLPLDLYFRTDTHWNGLGAFVAYRGLLASLSPVVTLPRSGDADLSQYEIETSPFDSGDLSSNMLNAQWRFTDKKVELVPHFTRSATEIPLGRSTAHPQDAVPNLTYEWTNRPVTGSVVMYGDSFSLAAIPYIQEHFGHGHLISGHIIDGEIVRRLRPDLVILEIVERHIVSLAVPPKSLDTVCQ